jgi:hypothetical protein
MQETIRTCGGRKHSLIASLNTSMDWIQWTENHLVAPIIQFTRRLQSWPKSFRQMSREKAFVFGFFSNYDPDHRKLQKIKFLATSLCTFEFKCSPQHFIIFVLWQLISPKCPHICHTSSEWAITKQRRVTACLWLRLMCWCAKRLLQRWQQPLVCK